jgi:hypothetical protein
VGRALRVPVAPAPTVSHRQNGRSREALSCANALASRLNGLPGHAFQARDADQAALRLGPRWVRAATVEQGSNGRQRFREPQVAALQLTQQGRWTRALQMVVSTVTR